jgi:hypothetical protein
MSGKCQNALNEWHALREVTAVGEQGREWFGRVHNHKSSENQATRGCVMEPGRNALGDVPNDGRLLSGRCDSAGQRRLNQPRWRSSDAIAGVMLASWNTSSVATTTSSNFKLGSFGMARSGASHFVMGAVTHRCCETGMHLCSCIHAVLQICNIVIALCAVE